MTKDLNTLLTAPYVLVDDHVVPPRTGRGHRPNLTDGELICLAVAQIMLGYHNERRWVRHVHADAVTTLELFHGDHRESVPQQMGVTV
ncbi:hypothetical protein [Actinophytocola sp.]|uniref:hypothetical protein n=1 Tax=Actinophytocola sp. TaxID=1872138 RepID=UPI0025C3E283|nr:hypothetical protein [Actinophytocola sp.]